MFSVIDAVLLRQLPYGDPNRLVVVWEKNHALGMSIGERVPVSHANFVEWARQAKSFKDIAGFESVNLNRTGAGEPERIEGTRFAKLLSGIFRQPGVRNGLRVRGVRSGQCSHRHTKRFVLADTLWRRSQCDRPTNNVERRCLHRGRRATHRLLPADHPGRL